MGDSESDGKQKHCKALHLHIAMCPWFAMGHLTAFLHLANKLAAKGHAISFFLPAKTRPKLTPLNHHPDLITFIPVTVHAVDGLPPGAETTADVPVSAQPLLMAAMDLTRPDIDAALARLRPDFFFYDFAQWAPGLARAHRVKAVYCVTVQVSFFAYLCLPARNVPDVAHLTEAELMQAPSGFPYSSAFWLRAHEAREHAAFSKMPYGPDGLSILEKVEVSIRECDAVCFRSCREMEGKYGEFFEKHYRKPVLWAGPVVPKPSGSALDKEIDGWLKGFEEGIVVYCALGSECVLAKDQFQELVLGLELTGLPFLAALRPPIGHDNIESALPKGFLERTKGKGIVHGGWVQQELILKHPSVGCFVTHCGSGSLSEALVSKCQMVLLPYRGDQYINARWFSGDLRVGVEVDKGDDDGLFTSEAVRKAIMTTMEAESEIGKEIKANHDKWREFLLRDGLEDSYITSFVENLRHLLEYEL